METITIVNGKLEIDNEWVFDLDYSIGEQERRSPIVAHTNCTGQHMNGIYTMSSITLGLPGNYNKPDPVCGGCGDRIPDSIVKAWHRQDHYLEVRK